MADTPPRQGMEQQRSPHTVEENALGYSMRYSLLSAGEHPPQARPIVPAGISENEVTMITRTLHEPEIKKVIELLTIPLDPNHFADQYLKHSGCRLCEEPWAVQYHFPVVTVGCQCLFGAICVFRRIITTLKHAIDYAQLHGKLPTSTAVRCPRCKEDMFPLREYVSRKYLSPEGSPFNELRFFAKLQGRYLDKIWTKYWYAHPDSKVVVDAATLNGQLDDEMEYTMELIEAEIENLATAGATGNVHLLLKEKLYTESIITTALKGAFAHNNQRVFCLTPFYVYLEDALYRIAWNKLYPTDFDDNGRLRGTRLETIPPPEASPTLKAWISRLITHTLVRARIQSKIAF